MAIQLPFGFEIRSDKAENPSFIAPDLNDGALEQSTSGAGFFGYSFNSGAMPKNEVDLINRYRQLQQISEVNSAIEEITSDAIVQSDVDDLVTIDLVNADETIPDEIQTAICDEFQNVMTILDFNNRGYDYFRQWYVDGRDYRHIVVDENNLSAGIKDVRYIDPRKIKKVREITKEKNSGGLDIITKVEEYFAYNESGFSSETSGTKLSSDTIVYTPSGITDEKGTVISYLHTAIKPANMLKYLEDASVIYKITRAPERRIFYIGVSGLPKSKGEQYIRDVMNKYRNKITYDSNTGDIKDDRQNYSMMEDYWLPRQGDGKNTEISTLPGATPWGVDDLQYFLNKLMASLNVPASRMSGDSNFALGRSEQITRDEVKFGKFIDRLRTQFSHMFSQLLRVQLILKGIIAPEDWMTIKSKIKYNFASDNYFSELKENEILTQRIQMVQLLEPYVGVYFSKDYIRENILRLSTEELKKTQKQLSRDLKESEDES